MSMKKTDLVKNLASKIDGRMKSAGVPGRFGQGAAELVDRREQRRRDTAAGLIPFACKLPVDLVKQLNERAAAHDGGINALVAELLAASLADQR
ncbi:MAG TPA: hypothetical protein VGP22_15225 [Albitalea sp.]|jgi:hypothetical protein|nr:hypothetical protein [Albitalea sp.]